MFVTVVLTSKASAKATPRQSFDSQQTNLDFFFLAIHSKRRRSTKKTWPPAREGPTGTGDATQGIKRPAMPTANGDTAPKRPASGREKVPWGQQSITGQHRKGCQGRGVPALLAKLENMF